MDEKSELVLIWCRRMLKEWEKEVAELPPEFLKEADGKFQIGILRQCTRYINPLIKLLQKKVCNSPYYLMKQVGFEY